MTAPFRTRGLDVVSLESRPGSLYAFDGTIKVGRVSPWVAGEPDGDWYARRTGRKAVRLPGRHQALAHVVGGCPDCLCEPGFCRTGGLHCAEVDCPYCLNGCTASLCAPTANQETSPR